MPRELSAEEVRQKCNPAIFGCESTKELEPLEGIIGQDRALSALNFGLNIQKPGFNIYVSGLPGTGRTTAIKSFLETLAAEKEIPPDWCYVHNFHDSYCPLALRLPAGTGRELQKDMKGIVEQARRSITHALESKEYAERQAEITQELNKQKEEALNRLGKKARGRGFLLKSTPVGLMFIPARDDNPLTEEEFGELSPEAKKELAKNREELAAELKEVVNKLRSQERVVHKQIENMNHQVVSYSIGHLFKELEEKYSQISEVVNYIKEVEQDIVENFEQFRLESQVAEAEPSFPVRELAKRQALKKYEVNILVDNSGQKGAPVVLELNPTFNNLFGRIEKEAQYGALYTDFTMIRSGSLHRANGGYLVVQARDILTNFMSWDGLKRAVRDGKIIIEEIGERFGFVTTRSLRPEPIPLNIKMVVIGEPLIYYLLYRLDPEFNELFKVKADFDSRMDKTEASLRKYMAVISRLCIDENLRHINSSAMAKIIEYSSRLAGDQGKLSTLFANIADVVRESNFWAGEAGSSIIEASHIDKAIEQKVYRSNLVQERINEMIEQGIIIIDVDGENIGQVNGLAVIDLGDFPFGKPSRITASVGLGREGLIDIERESKLGGPVHTKGIMILNGYMADKYVRDIPLSLSARLVFEQSYEEVEGDSASSAELYALLSCLSDVPLKQGIAVTGSVNQKGEVQAIGGLNEKIEGFFEVCRANGLNGKQGVLIPVKNIRNLMLKEEVVEAVRRGDFHIYPVATIDEGIEVLTGITAGRQLPDGNFESGSINDRVQRRLIFLAEKFRDFTKGEEKVEVAGNGGHKP